MKIIISGINGFIGRNLNELLKSKYTIFDYHKHKKTKFSNKDIFIHLSSRLKLNSSDLSLIDDDFKSNFEILNFCIKNQIKKFIFISSATLSAIDFNLNKINSIYVLNKYYFENFFNLYLKKNNIEFISLRFPNIYGPFQINKNNQGIMPVLYNAFKKDEVFFKWGNGNDVKNYLYIDDAVNLILKVVDKTKIYDQHIYTALSNDNISINDLICYFEDFFNKKIKIITDKKLASDYNHPNFDSNLELKKNYNWEPRTRFKDGLKKYINFCESDI